MAPKPKPGKKGKDAGVKAVIVVEPYKPDPSVVKKLRILEKIKASCNFEPF